MTKEASKDKTRLQQEDRLKKGGGRRPVSQMKRVSTDDEKYPKTRQGPNKKFFLMVFQCFSHTPLLGSCSAGPARDGRRSFPKVFLLFSNAFPRVFSISGCLGPCAAWPAWDDTRSSFPKVASAFLKICSIPGCLGPCAAGPARDGARSFS